MGELPTNFGGAEQLQGVRLEGEQGRSVALRLLAKDPEHTAVAAGLLKANTVGVIAYNGIYGLFTNADNEEASKEIYRIKDRPNDKNLVLVSMPEHLDEHVDFSKIPYYDPEQIAKLQTTIHALGIILPASNTAPQHLVATRNDQQTILSIWTEYKPLRHMMETFRAIGGRALAGTSANKSGEATHVFTAEAWETFRHDVRFFVEADFSHLADLRKKSTSVIDLTTPQPRLHRSGNTTTEEIREALSGLGFPELYVPEEKQVIFVQSRLTQ